MDELAHTAVPLIRTIRCTNPDSPRLPPYKLYIPEGATTLPYTLPHKIHEQRDADLHLRWGLEVARLAPNYPYPVPTRPHRFMHLAKFPASRIHQMRAGPSYLSGQPDFLVFLEQREPNLTCRHCGEGEETFHHAAITCPACARDRLTLCPELSSVAANSNLWKSLEDLRSFARFIVYSRINFPSDD